MVSNDDKKGIFDYGLQLPQGLYPALMALKYIRTVFAVEWFTRRLMKHLGSDIAPVNINGLLR